MNEKLTKIVNDPKFAPVVTGVVSFGIGMTVGYILGRNRKREIHIVPSQKKPFDHEAMEDFLDREEAKRGIVREKTVIEEVVIETPAIDHAQQVGEDFVAQQLKEDIQSHQGSAQPLETVRRSIFAENTDDWDYDEELKHRSPAQPYILHKDEFYNEEMENEGFSQTTLTYYAGDDIMTDQEDHPIYNYGSVVGPLKFGHGSGDHKVFYVRNHRRKAEYEIIHDPGLYSVEVEGLEIEQNDRVKALDKFRQTD